MNVYLTVEDQISIKLVDQTRAQIQTEIDKQTEKKARLECQIMLLKIQLADSVEETEKMKAKALARIREIRD